ncbi:MAG: HDIG domain-containing metalloprotein, partial [Chloroflexota bacterium]
AVLRNTDQVVGTGMTGPEALRQGRRNRPKTKLDIRYVSDKTGEPLELSPLLSKLASALARVDQPVYLVGGAVRDALLGKVSHDLDFVVPKNGIKVAYQIGDYLRVPAFVLDDQRDVGRVVLRQEGIYLDIAAFRAETLEGDLRDRDYTFNAMALPALAETSAELIDPLNGFDDLKNGLLRPACPSSLSNDPVRILRGVRMGLKYSLEPDDATAKMMADAIPQLSRVSAERVRDELLNILNVDGAGGLERLRSYGLLAEVLPEITKMLGVEQTSPHHEPVFEHTVSVVRWLQKLLRAEALVDWFAPILEKVANHLNRSVTGERHGRDLILLAALYHDVGKPETQSFEIDADGSTRIRFFQHDKVGAKLTEARLKYFRLSGEAVKHTVAVVQGHMRPLLLASEDSVSVKAKHRFWRKYQTAGIDICLLSIADHLATYSGTGPSKKWEKYSGTVTDLLDHWFMVEAPIVKAPSLVTGRDLMDGLGIKGGPHIGQLLVELEEAQVAGEITTAAEALTLAERLLNRSSQS